MAAAISAESPYNDPRLRERIRVLESWGPHPIQPIVTRAGLPPALRAALAETLLTLHLSVDARRQLAAYGVARFAPVRAADYEPARVALRACAEVSRAWALPMLPPLIG